MPRLTDAEKAGVRLLVAAWDYGVATNRTESRIKLRSFAQIQYDFGFAPSVYLGEVAKRYRRLRDHLATRTPEPDRHPNDSLQWVADHPGCLSEYAGKWVAMDGPNVVGSGDSYGDARDVARANGCAAPFLMTCPVWTFPDTRPEEPA